MLLSSREGNLIDERRTVKSYPGFQAMPIAPKSKPKLRGYVYRLSDTRILERLEASDTFTDVFGYGEVHVRQLALISFDDGTIDALATMVRGYAVASYKRVARFAEVALVEPPLEIDDLLSTLPRPPSEAVASALTNGGPIDPVGFVNVMDGLVSARPGLEATLSDLATVLGAGPVRGGRGGEVLGFERDAIGVALDAAGLDRLRPEVLRAWRPGIAPAPYLRGLGDRTFNEDQMLAHDIRVFGDWGLHDDEDPLVVSFTDGRRQVTVANVNRTSVETSTGADLIYYSHDWSAYVLVQYKRMEHEVGRGWSLRPTRAGRLPEELERLKSLPRAGGAAAEAAAFRLSDEAAYLKLCRQLHLGAGQGRLADGIYLPVSFYELLIASPETLGPRGGRRLSLDSLNERWLTNGSFVEMVGRGFIGSRETDTDVITEQIQKALRDGRSVTLAVGGHMRVSSSA